MNTPTQIERAAWQRLRDAISSLASQNSSDNAAEADQAFICLEDIIAAELSAQPSAEAPGQPVCQLCGSSLMWDNEDGKGVRCMNVACRQPSAELQPAASVHYPHTWERDGERCTVCGDKDWMGGSCRPPESAPKPAAEASDSEMDGESISIGEITRIVEEIIARRNRQ